jgi:tetratricopeptide (TPR) repeat protein
VSGSAHIADLAVTFPTGSSWAMVRTHFGIQSFGVNAYIADEAGKDVIGEHDELGVDSGGHEELYFVSNGHATFTVNGDEIDAPLGTFVFVRDPAAKRRAVAREPSTTVLVVGGRPSETFTPSPWERNAEGLLHFGNEDYEQAAETFERLLAETPGNAGFLYNLACAESRLGRKAEALSHLREAIGTEPQYAASAPADPDLEAIRDEPEFSEITGQAGSAGARS